MLFAVLYAESAAKYALKDDCFIYMAVNAHWEEHTFELPVIPEGKRWYCIMDSWEEKRICEYNEDRVLLKPRSMVLLCTKIPEHINEKKK